ncbi:Uncharacterised protein [Vibrio harveyi]|nr:Uncharacterised protein [Vibrio harveyi]
MGRLCELGYLLFLIHSNKDIAIARSLNERF